MSIGDTPLDASNQAGTIHKAVRFAQIPEWILDSVDLTDKAVRLYGVLDRYADKDGACFPGRKTIATRLGWSVDSVDRAIANLANYGALTVKADFHPGTEIHRSNIYTLQLVPWGGGRTHAATGSRTAAATGGRTHAATKNESHKERESYRTKTLSLVAAAPQIDHFDEWYTVYPLKKEKVAARKAYAKASKTVPHEVLLKAAIAYRDDPTRDPNFTKYPATWLNKGCYADDVKTRPPATQRPRPAHASPTSCYNPMTNVWEG